MVVSVERWLVDVAQATLLPVAGQVPACSEVLLMMTAPYLCVCRPVVDRILRSAYSSGTRDLGAASPVAVLQVDQPLHEVVQAVGRVEPRLLPTSTAKTSHVKASWHSAVRCLHQHLLAAPELAEPERAGPAQRRMLSCWLPDSASRPTVASGRKQAGSGQPMQVTGLLLPRVPELSRAFLCNTCPAAV